MKMESSSMKGDNNKDNLELKIVVILGVILVIRLEQEMIHFYEKKLSLVERIWSLISKNYILILNIVLCVFK